MKANIQINPARVIGSIDPMIYGQFLSRRLWVSDQALYDPEHPHAREDGLRREVVDAVIESAPSVIRWPGGCTGTTYDWRDGVGPQSERPRVIDAHFGYGVGNGFGTAEFVKFCRDVGAEAQINLTTGTGDLREALAWVEYANLDTDTKWANLRRRHGYDKPFGVKYWQIGNEEWGPWEIGYTTAEANGARAREWAKSIKKLDPAAKVLALGGGNAESMLDWTRRVVADAGRFIDYVTQHRYWDFDARKGIDNYDQIVSVGYREEQLMKALGGLIDLVAHEHRLPRKPRLAYTEWNCRDKSHNEMTPSWHPSTAQYRLIDALACAGFINAMQRQCNYVTLANFAQTVNVVGMLLVTPEFVLKETVFWALVMQRRFSGDTAIDAWVDCDTYTVDMPEGTTGPIPYLDVSATMDKATGRQTVSIVNSHRSEVLETSIELTGSRSSSATVHQLWDDDPFAKNSAERPDRIAPRKSAAEVVDGKITLSLPPHSYTVVEV
ncbi:MAG TPA: alpha-L-arabinofuranosidase C-terminal domain-containing protein [Devosia sp.]|nr:alpha-L-arabinofuranosidase C-terminal domain-containing protein [Devosia sp.]